MNLTESTALAVDLRIMRRYRLGHVQALVPQNHATKLQFCVVLPTMPKALVALADFRSFVHVQQHDSAAACPKRLVGGDR